MTEILAPAGNKECALAAINSGANAIYLGLTSFSARSSAENFDESALGEILSLAHFFGVKVYVAMNTLVKEGELSSFVSTAVSVWNMGADAIIIQDMYLGKYLKDTYPDMVLHLSTQAGVCNTYAAEYAKSLGFSRVILSRETRLEDIKSIAGIIETEVFIQGALCTCFSGQCYLSSFAGGNSGNRGRCKQPCRKQYKINRPGFEEYAYRISLSDLCMGEDIQKLEDCGVASFKIEGRMRRAEYVAAAVTYYKKILENKCTLADLSALKRTYNRGNYTKGLAFGQDKSLISSAVQGHIGEFVGVIAVESGKYIVKTPSRFVKGDAFKILRGGKELCGATYFSDVKGGIVLSSSTRLKNGDKAFITTDSALSPRLLSDQKKKRIVLSASFFCGIAPTVCLNEQVFTANFTAQSAANSPITECDIKSCFLKTDCYPYEVEFSHIETDGKTFIPKSQLNAFRREVYLNYFNGISQSKNAELTLKPLPNAPHKAITNSKRCVIAGDFAGETCDIAVLKPQEYAADMSERVKDFNGEKFLYLPPYLTDAEIEFIKPLITPFDGIYSGGNYAVPLSKELHKKLFCGCGFNLSNSVSVSNCPGDYIALSKELTLIEAEQVATDNSFYLTEGDIKVMDLSYCPFSKTCSSCDKRSAYTLTDIDGREFPLRRYRVGANCRFEVFNCAALQSQRPACGTLCEHSIEKSFYKSHTKGHTQNPVL